MRNKIIKIYSLFFLTIFIVVFAATAESAINQQINYQGKLANSAGVAVANGSYNLRFQLCAGSTCAAGGDPIWTETLCYSPDDGTTCDGTGVDQRVAVTSGLFSVMLGSVSVLTSVNFNQTLYLEVQVGGSDSTPDWEILTPRKILGAVPAAFEAKQLEGFTWAVPGAIGSTTPSTGTFSALSATSLALTDALTTQYGGAGQNWSAVTTGSMPYFSDTGTMSTIAAGTSTYVFTANGPGVAPTWQAATAGTVTGTGTATYLAYWDGASSLTASAGLTYDGTTLTSGGGFATNSSSTGVNISGASGVLTLAGVGNTNNENLTFDFETVVNTVGISSGTGVTALNFNGLNITSTGTASFGSLALTSSALTTQYGGAGQNWSAVTTGSMPYFSDTGTMSTIAAGTSTYVFTANGPGVAPTWQAATGGIAGTGSTGYNAYWTSASALGNEQYVALSRGGTNASITANSGAIIYSGASALSVNATGTAGQALLSGGTGAPTWGTLSTTYGGAGQNWSAVTTGSMPYFSDTGTMSTIAAGTSTYVFTANGPGVAPTWQAATGMVYPDAGIAVSTGSAWDTSITAANISSLADLSYASASFVKMTGANTFTLDTTTYLGTATATATYVPYSGATGAVDLGAQNLTTTGTGTFGQIIDNGLSNENIPYLNSGKQLVGSANLNFDGTNFSIGAIATSWLFAVKGSTNGLIFNDIGTSMDFIGFNGAAYNKMIFRAMATATRNQLVLHTDGKIGFGTTAPAQFLDINTGAATGGIRLTYNDADGSATVYGDILIDSAGDVTLSATGGDFSFSDDNIITTGSIGGGVITGTSFVIGANTISSFANLDSLADLSYASASFVKMTDANTFTLDTNTYMTNPMDAIGQIIYGGDSGTPTKLSAGSSGQILQSGGAGAPAWTTATYPATAGTSGKILISDGTNIISSTPTYPNAATTTGAYLRADGTNFIQSTLLLPNAGTAYKLAAYTAANTLSELAAVGTTGTILTGVTGAIPVWTTATYPSTTTASQILYSTAINTIGGTASLTFDDTNGLGISNAGASQVLSGNGSLALGGVSGSNNEILTFDFESVSDQVGISSSTGVTTLNLTGLSMALGAAADANTFSTSSHGATSTLMYIGNYTINVTAPSDVKTKKNIAIADGKGIDELMKLTIKNFEYKKQYVDEGKMQKQHTGLIAQEVEEVFPDAIIYRSDDLIAIDYAKLVPYIIKSVQDIQTEISTGQISSGTFTFNQLGSVGDGEVSGAQKAWLSKGLASLGLNVTQGILTAKEMIADSFTVETAKMNQMELVDHATGELYCTWIENGEWQKTKGACNVQEPVVEEPVVEEPVVQEPVVEEPVVQEPVVQEPVVQEPVVQEPVVQEPVVEEPVVQEPVVEEPVVEEPVVEEPQNPGKQKKSEKEKKSLEVSSVAPISDITVANGTAIDQTGLQSAVTATLSDATTQDLQITWDNGNPSYDASVAGDYILTGALTLPETISNSNNLMANCKIIVQKPVAQEPEPQIESEEPPPVGEIVQEVTSALLDGMWQFIKWVFGASVSGVNKIIPENIKQSSASISFSVAQNVKSDFQQLFLQAKSASQILIKPINKLLGN